MGNQKRGGLELLVGGDGMSSICISSGFVVSGITAGMQIFSGGFNDICTLGELLQIVLACFMHAAYA